MIIFDDERGNCASDQGGSDQGIPLVVSEMDADGPALRCGLLNVGDTILAVNGIDLKKVANRFRIG